MTPERWRQVKELFQAALERDRRERVAFLDEACAGDPSLRRQVEALLAAHEQAASFLDAPAFEVAIKPLTNDRAESAVGRHIGPYKVLHEIGHGGMGAVYLAVRADDEYRKRVAIKVLKRGMSTDAIVRRFLNERQILAGLDHPNIAKLLDGGTTEEDLPYFVMDYVEGLPINVYCDTHRLSTVARLKLFRAVCSAVHYAHQNLVVHRDLKPGNILVTAEGVPKLLDFGIAKLLNPELSSQTMEPTVALRLMTPAYASPEQVRGGTITTASDVYTLGVLLYELLTGHPPYRIQYSTPQEIERVISEEEPEKPSMAISRMEEVLGPDGTTPITLTPGSVSRTRDGQPEKLRRNLAGDLDNIVLMAMRKEPQRRYASVEQLSEDIRRHLDGLPVIARKDTLAYRSTKFIKRNKVVVIAAVLIMVSLLAGLMATTWQAHRVERQALSNRRLLYAAHMNLACRAWEDVNIGRVLELLEAQRPKPGQEDLRGFEWYYLWRLCHSDQFASLQHAGQVWSVAFSPDGKTLATGSVDNTVKLWDVATQQELITFKGHTDRVWSVVFSPDGKTLATGSDDGTAKLWDVTTRQELITLKGHTEVLSVAFSPDGKTLARAGWDGTVKLWDVAARQELVTLTGHREIARSVAFSPDGKILASGSQDGGVKLWDVAIKQERATLKGHQDSVMSIAFSPDGKALATGSADGTVKLWDVATRQELVALKGHKDWVISVAFSPDGKTLATGSADSTVKLWDAQTLVVASGRVKSMYHEVKAMASEEELRTFKGHTREVRSVAFSPDGKTLATGSADCTVKLWHMTTKQELTTLKGHTGGVNSVAFSPDGKTLATGSRDSTIKLWDVATRQELITLRGHKDGVNSVAFSPDGKTLATGSRDSTIKLWDVATRQELITLKGHKTEVLSLVFLPDGKTLVAGSLDCTVKLWDVVTRQELITLKRHTDAVLSVASSPDGKTLATGSRDGTIMLWDVARRREVTTLTGHSRMVTSVAFSPDGKRLVTGSYDFTVRLWDLPTGQELAALKEDQKWPLSMAFSPDGNTLATGGLDSTVKLWHAATSEVLAKSK